MDVFEFRLINPSTGLADILLPDVETYVIAPMKSDVGAIQFTYPSNGINANQLLDDREISIWYQGVEQGRLRSTLEQQDLDKANLAEDGYLGKYTARTNLCRLERAVVYPQGWPTTNNPPSVQFTGATAGAMLLYLITAAQARGTIPYIDTSSFTATHDSAGNAWTEVLTLKVNAQINYLTFMQTLVGYGMCECEMNIYSLKVYDTSSIGVDRTIVEPPLTFRKGRDLTQAQVLQSTRTLSTVALMAGASNLYVETSSAPAISVYGRREVGGSQTGVTDAGTLISVGQSYLATLDAELVSTNNAVSFADPSTPFPIRDFDLGDWVYEDLGDGVYTRRRIISWTVNKAADGTLTGTVILDTIFQEKINRIRGVLQSLEDGTSISGTSNPDSVPKLLYPPQIPTGLNVVSSSYQDNQGHTFAQATLTWNAVTQDTNGGAETSLDNYLVQYRTHGTTQWSDARPVSATVTNCQLSPFLPGIQMDFQVGVVDTQGNFSGWSGTVVATLASDIVAPNQPSIPVVTSQLGQLNIVWDGLDYLGGVMPGDFDHLEVHVSSAGSSFTPSSATLFNTMKTKGSTVVSNTILIYGTTYYVKTIAVDQSGNKSVASAVGSATLVQVVTTDIATGQVGLGNIAFSDVGNMVDDGNFEDPKWQATRNAQFGGTHFALDNSTASIGAWSVKHTGVGGLGYERITLTIVNAKPGQTFMGAADWKVTNAVTNSMFVSIEAFFLDSNSNILAHGHLTDNWVSPATNDNAWHTRVSGTPQTAPANTTQMQIVLTSDNHTAGTIWADAVEVRMQLDTLLIANAAITNAKINDLSANKITAGTLSAGVILSGSIGTDASPNQRVVMDGTGLHAYNSSNQKIFDLSSSTPVVTIGQSSVGGTVTVDTSYGTIPGIVLKCPGSTTQSTIYGFDLGGGQTSFGIDSNAFSANSTTLGYRLAMDGIAGAFLIALDSTQKQNGGGLWALPTFAKISATDSSHQEAAYWAANTDGTVTGVGKFHNYVYAGTTDAWFTGQITSNTNSLALAYGPTMASLLVPIVTCQYSPGSAWSNVTANSTTGFTIGSAVNANQNFNFWCFRV